jgi:hypothetical protein
VYTKYFCKAVPFWEKGGGEVFAGMKSRTNLFCTNHRKDSAPTRASIVPELKRWCRAEG